MSTAIPAHAVNDYEALRDQLFGIGRLDVRSVAYSVFIRRGLAAWTQCRQELPASLRFEPKASVAVPAADDGTRALLARLLAHLILTPKETPSCQM
jgi:hypothetical protein